MFAYSSAFNRELGEWDVSSVTDMNHMFNKASGYTGKGIANRDVSSVTDTGYMLYHTTNFKAADLSDWDVRNVETFAATFSFCQVFDGNMTGWGVSSANAF